MGAVVCQSVSQLVSQYVGASSMGASEHRSVGTSEHQSVGASDRGCGSVGVSVLKCRTMAVGVSECRYDCLKIMHRFNVGLLICRSVRMWECGCIGVVRRNIGPRERRSVGQNVGMWERRLSEHESVGDCKGIDLSVRRSVSKSTVGTLYVGTSESLSVGQ